MTADRPPLEVVPNRPGVEYAAEQAVLGAILSEPALAAELEPELNAGDFYSPRHETIWSAIYAVAATGQQPDPILVGKHLARTRELDKIGGGAYLHTLMAACPVPGQAGHYANIVRDGSRLRQVQEVATRLATLGTRNDDINQALADALDTLDTACMRFGPANRTPTRHVLTIDEFLEATDPGYDWIVHGLLERRDRVILTGPEGGGKSTLGRQLAVQTAAGIHPFTGELIKPIRVLILDFENSDRQLRRALRPLRVKAGDRLDPAYLRIESHIEGVDLTNQGDDREWVEGIIATVQPDLVVTGPIYKMADGDPNEEKSAKPVALFIDHLRATYGAAFWIEAHVGNETQGQRKRPTRPYGWSGWRRWPEFGLWLDEDGAIEHWRGDRDQRDWPELLNRGGDWPWSKSRHDHDPRWARIRECIIDAGKKLSLRELERRTGIPRATVSDILGRYAMQHQNLLHQLHEGDLDDDD